jgi:toxin HigB-1
MPRCLTTPPAQCLAPGTSVRPDCLGRLGDLRAPPSNRLEKLKGKLEGQYSTRINEQWRVCFRWTESGAEDVEVVDYHGGR